MFPLKTYDEERQKLILGHLVTLMECFLNEYCRLPIQYVDTKIAELNMPVDVITPDDLKNVLPRSCTTGPTQQDFTALTQTMTAAINQVAANVADKATQQDVSLAATAVDAKFDMLRSAIKEATDYDTLKARLLAVLE